MKFISLTNNLVAALVVLAAACSLALLYSQGRVVEARIGGAILLMALCLILWGSMRPSSTKKDKSRLKQERIRPNEAISLPEKPRTTSKESKGKTGH
jgi:hypothetical protein